jgi:hypothetical protein
MTKQEHERDYPRLSASREIKLTRGSSARVVVCGGGLSVMLIQPIHKEHKRASSVSDIVLLGTEDMERLNAAIQETRQEANDAVGAVC